MTETRTLAVCALCGAECDVPTGEAWQDDEGIWTICPCSEIADTIPDIDNILKS